MALDPSFGISEGGSTIIDTNWNGEGAGTLVEAGNGSGWTFILGYTTNVYPLASDLLDLFINPSFIDTSNAGGGGLTAQETRDAVGELAPGGAPAAGSIDQHLDTLLTGQTTIVNAVAAVQTVVDALQNNTRFVGIVPAFAMIPQSGNNLYKLISLFYDEEGNMKDPDDLEEDEADLEVDLDLADGTDKNSLLFDDAAFTTPATAGFFPGHVKMKRIGVGRFELFLKVPSTEVIGQYQ